MPSTRSISANGIELFLREQGQGPLVALCHGWPELSCSWRHQISAIAGAGFHVAAPDMPRPTQGNAALIEFLRG
jgi:pimeloyl-ACP methyl ester carboxylesterase